MTSHSEKEENSSIRKLTEELKNLLVHRFLPFQHSIYRIWENFVGDKKLLGAMFGLKI